MTSAIAEPVGGLFEGPPRYVPQSPWSPIPAILVTLIACGASLVVGMLAIFVVMLARGPSASPSEADIMAMFSLSTMAGVVTAMTAQLTSLAIIWLSAGYKGMRREVMQFNGWPPLSTVAAGAAILVAATSALELIMYLTTSFDVFADSRWLREGLSGPYMIATVVIAVVFAPLWEELTFRGFLLSALAQTRLGFWGAGLLSNTMWTALHWGYSWQGILSVFTAGLVLTWMVRRTGSIWPSVIVHAIANTCALAFVYFWGVA